MIVLLASATAATFISTIIALVRTSISVPLLHLGGPRAGLFVVIPLFALLPGVEMAVELTQVFWLRFPEEPSVNIPEGLSTMPLAVWTVFLGPLLFCATRLLVAKHRWSPALRSIRTRQVVALVISSIHTCLWASLI